MLFIFYLLYISCIFVCLKIHPHQYSPSALHFVSAYLILFDYVPICLSLSQGQTFRTFPSVHCRKLYGTNVFTSHLRPGRRHPLRQVLVELLSHSVALSTFVRYCQSMLQTSAPICVSTRGCVTVLIASHLPQQ